MRDELLNGELIDTLWEAKVLCGNYVQNSFSWPESVKSADAENQFVDTQPDIDTLAFVQLFT